jgi:hypothetical protein
MSNTLKILDLLASTQSDSMVRRPNILCGSGSSTGKGAIMLRKANARLQDSAFQSLAYQHANLGNGTAINRKHVNPGNFKSTERSLWTHLEAICFCSFIAKLEPIRSAKVLHP